MKLQKKPQHWQCGVTSAAMVLNMPVADLIAEIGHDGGLLPGSEWRDIVRGYHIQEFIDVFYKHGFAATPVEIFPVSMDSAGRHWRGHTLSEKELQKRFYDTILTSRGMVEGEKPLGGHMIAYDHGQIYDPNGYDYTYELFSIYNFKPLCAWRVDAILPGRA